MKLYPTTPLRGISALKAHAAALASIFVLALALGIPFVAISGTGEAGVAQSAAGQFPAHEHDPPLRAKRKTRAASDTPFGREGDPRKARRVVKIEMSDAMRYFPDHVAIKKGQTVRFAVRNGGEVPHEMVLGTMDDLKMHAALMKKNAETAQDDPNVAYVAPGRTGRIVWQFTKAGEFYYGCLVPGHFDAGMIGTIVVR